MYLPNQENIIYMHYKMNYMDIASVFDYWYSIFKKQEAEADSLVKK